MIHPALAALFLLASMSLPAQAFDCAKASTKTEKLICSDTELKAADDAMGAAWKRLGDLLDKDEMQSMRVSQRAWLKWRSDRCGYGGDAERIECLEQLTSARALLLAGEPRTGPGTGSRMVPFAFYQQGSKTRFEIDISGTRFAGPQRPGELAFNKALDDGISGAPVNDTVDFETPAQLSYSETMSVEYAGPQLLSVLSSVWRYDGGAHGNYYSTGLNFALDQGELQFSDLFADAALQPLAIECRNRLSRAETSEVLSPQERRENLFEDTVAVFAEQMKSLRAWSFDTQGARVHFAPYAIASYAAGSFECRLPLELLSSLSKAPQYLPR